MYEKNIMLGFIRVHILHHASQMDGFHGSWMIKELEHHGYDISPGTLYPILHDMRDKGLLVVTVEVVEGKVRKIYRATPEGHDVLDRLKASISELSREVLE